MKKTLILVDNIQYYFLGSYVSDSITFAQLYKGGDNRLLVRTARALFRRLHINQERYYDSWAAGGFEKVVIFDNCFFLDPLVFENVRALFPACEIYAYGWNIDYPPKAYLRILSAARASGVDYYHFDRQICEVYGLLHNSIMFDENIASPEVPVDLDVVFLGKSKDRTPAVVSAANTLSELGASSRIILVGDVPECPIPSCCEVTSEYVSYQDYLSLVARCRILLDIEQEGQTGLSMRVMEALFLRKKLITTNRDVRDAPFYSSGNVFVFDPNAPDRQGLRDFISRPYASYDERDLEYYSIPSWLSRFTRRNVAPNATEVEL